MMYLPAAARFAVALAALSGTTAAMGMNKFRRDLTWASQLGIDPSELFNRQKSLQLVDLQSGTQNLTAQYVTVSDDWINCWFDNADRIASHRPRRRLGWHVPESVLGDR